MVYPEPEQVEEPENPDQAGHNSKIIFLNPCWGGCTIYRGYPDNSVNDTSFIPSASTSYIPEFSAGQSTWNAVVSCVRAMYEDFDIAVVDEDPSPAPHFEAIVAGSPGDIGQPNYVGGIAPSGCSIVNNAISYTFAEVYGGSAQAICETAAQETAHSFTLDHEYYCPDPMTYLYGCGPKQFRDYDAPCGEDQARNCSCGRGATQNSYAIMYGHFGPSEPSPPSVNITQPLANAAVQPQFVIRVDATDDVLVDYVELRIDGDLITTVQSPPWVFNAPEGLGEGNHTVRITAYDNRGDAGSDEITVVMGEPCTGDSGCESGQACVDGRCVIGPDQPGGLGEECTDSNQCYSGLCGNDGQGNMYCTEQCDSDADGCPSGFDCLSAGDTGVCWPGADGGGGCAASTDSTPAIPAVLFAIFGAAFLFRRRRRD
jgi:MYXO-CTERM domain-containing protein